VPSFLPVSCFDAFTHYYQRKVTNKWAKNQRKLVFFSSFDCEATLRPSGQRTEVTNPHTTCGKC
jgi:hypothetical protein